MRVYVLKVGTVNWELETIRHHGFDTQNGIRLDVQGVASGSAAKASRQAKGLMAEEDAEWDRLRPLMNAKTQAEFDALKTAFRAGIPRNNQVDAAAAARMFRVMAAYGGPRFAP